MVDDRGIGDDEASLDDVVQYGVLDPQIQTFG